MNWKLLLFAFSLILGITARPAEETTPESSTISVPTSTDLPVTKPGTTPESTTARPKSDGKIEVKDETPNANENRELKVGSNLQLTTGNNNNEISIKESSYHHGIAVPLTLEEYEKEIEREKEMINKAKKKIAMESSTPKDGISTWILLSGSNNPTTRPEMKPAFRIDSDEKKQQPKNNTMTTKKKMPTTVSTTKLPKPTPKYNNKLLTKVKVVVMNETDVEVTTKAAPTTKKPQLTTKAKKYTTLRPKTTTTTVEPSTVASKTTTAQSVEIIDDDTEEQQTAAPLETSTFLIMEPKDADFNLPADRSPSKATPTKKAVKISTATKNKKKKIAAVGTNSTRIKKKSDKKNSHTKLSSKTPEKPITTQIYNYLAREVMPSVGVGLVGLVVTAGLATYFLGGPLTALRRSYDISNRRDDSVAFDRSDDFGNTQNEEEMFGKVIAGMPENSAYRNNIRVGSYRPKAQPYTGYPQYTQQTTKYTQPQLRYRTVDPYQNAYQTQSQNQFPQYYSQQIMAQTQPKSAEKNFATSQQQQVQQPQGQQVAAVYTDSNTNNQKFNIDTVDMTTNNPEANYINEYDEIAQSYFPQHEDTASNQVISEKQNIQEIESDAMPQNEVSRSEKVSIVHAQSVPSNHRNETPEEQSLPTPAALTLANADEEYQNSIANAIMSQKKQFVVGSVVAENFEESPPSIVPEHGPRRRRGAEVKAAKSLENNEIEDEDNLRLDAESSTAKAEEHSTTDEVETTTASNEIHSSSVHDDLTTQYTVTYNIENPQNNILDLFRRILDMKLRMGLNFLQNATLAFQHYLKGVEQRVNTSPMFNPYKKNETAPIDTRKVKDTHDQKVETL